MYYREAILIWAFGLVLPEILGLFVARLILSYGLDRAYAIGLAAGVIASIRLLLTVYIARVVGVGLTSLIYRPLPVKPAQLLLLITLIVAVAVIDYIVTTTIRGSYKPQLADYKFYAEHGVIYLFPFQLAYYFSEIVVVNFMYLLAKKSWSLLGSPIAAGIAFVILAWALPHVLTKDFKVAIHASILAILFYTGYEATGSPLTPIILWFVILLV